MAADLWVINIIKIIITVIALHLTLTKVMPLIQDFLNPFIDKKPSDALTSLFGVLAIVIAGSMIVGFLLAIGNPAMEYLAVIGAGFELLKGFFDYLQYVVIVVLGIAVLKTYKSKK